MTSGLVDCMAHLDFVKIFGFRPTKDLSDLLEGVLTDIRSANLAMELSTAGWRKSVGELYPATKLFGAEWRKQFRYYSIGWLFVCAPG